MAESVPGSEFFSRVGFTREDWRECAAQAAAAAGRLRLTFGRDIRGTSGGMTGSGAGVSIDFKDHRRYFPGDDPRHINWRAYARTGQPVMKVFHEEVSPRADVLLDLSASHTHEREKLAATLRLALFACLSAGKRGASVKLFLTRDETVAPLDVGAFMTGRWDAPGRHLAAESVVPVWHRVPWRTRALRLIVSDLLFPGEPEDFLAPVAREASRTILLAPYSKSECEPDWKGHVTLTDCETGERRERRGGEALGAQYGEAYRRHFRLWDDASRRRGATLARVPSAGALSTNLLGEPLRLGVVEPA